MTKLAGALEIGAEDLMEEIKWVPSDKTGGHFKVEISSQFEVEAEAREHRDRARQVTNACDRVLDTIEA